MDIGLAIVILSVVVIVVIFLQFYRVLGRRTGFEGSVSNMLEKSMDRIGINSHAKDAYSAPEKPTEVPEIPSAENLLAEIDACAPIDTPLNNNFRKIYSEDKMFSPSRLLGHSKFVYEHILQNYANGDVSAISPFVTADVLNVLENQIEKDKQEKISKQFSFVGLEKAEFVAANVRDGNAFVELHFISEVVLVVKNEAGEIIKGSEKSLTVLEDNWIFTRNLAKPHEIWRVWATATPKNSIDNAAAQVDSETALKVEDSGIAHCHDNARD